MSINVIIGSDPQDLVKINDTISALTFLRGTVPGQTNLLDLNGHSFDNEKLENLIDWYLSLRNVIMYVGNTEDTVLEPITT